MSDTNDRIREALALQEKIRRLTEPPTTILNALQNNAALLQAIEGREREVEMVRAALAPSQELRRRFVDDAQFQLPRVQEVTKLLREYEDSTAARFFRDHESSTAARFLRQIDDQNAQLRRAMEAMRVPWLDSSNPTPSFAAFAELQGIGHTLRTLPPFDSDVAEQLRADLGDWRAPLSLTAEALIDPLARTEFYLAQGLDLALTSFPAATFLESTVIAGLRQPPPAIADAYNDGPYDVTPNDDEERSDDDEESFTRTNAAHDRLLRFETQVRRFIDERMTAAFGPKWIKQRVPGSMRKAWEERRDTAREAGGPARPLIAYADFTDYVAIITRKDNWEALFAPVFKRQALVQESFQRLYPIRLCTMHARVITQDDELYLLVETMRLSKAMGFHGTGQ